MNHLTDEQLADWLAGDANPETQAHLESCAQCRVEARQLRDGISRYAMAMRRQSAEAQRAHMAANHCSPEGFGAAPSALGRSRSAGAAAGGAKPRG